jgi:pseudaminic acid biosynthesis-associated methylase
MDANLQVDTWSTQFGKEYTDRNTFTTEQLDKLYLDEYGVSRSDMNRTFLDDLYLYNGKILEVGCNVGNQLRLLQKLGYKNLFGIELQSYAVETAKSLTKGINIIQGLANDIPFKDEYFDLVFTSGVLIHIAPGNIGEVLDEVYRCTRQYIWGFEYYADEYTEVTYRGNKNLLWKANFAKLYLDRFPNLKLVKEVKFKYIHNDNIDSMFLLVKKR